MKIDERVEKDCRTLENTFEARYAALQEENKELHERNEGLVELTRRNGWTMHGLLDCMAQMEARMALLSGQVSAMAPPISVDLTREEDEGGVGGPLLGSLVRLRSLSLLRLEEAVNAETLEAIEALGRSWDFVGRDATTSGEYTPTGPRYQSPEL